MSNSASSSKLWRESSLSFALRIGVFSLNLSLIGWASRALAPFQFDRWIYLVYWITLIAGVDFGVGALRNGLISHVNPRRLFFSFFYLFLFFSCITACAFSPFEWVLAVACLRIPLGLSASAFYASQEASRKGVMDLIEVSLSCVGTGLGFFWGRAIEGYGLGSLAGSSLSFIALLKQRKWKWQFLSWIEIKQEVTPYLFLTRQFLLQSLLSTLLFSLLVWMVRQIQGPAISSFLLLHRLFSILTGVQISLLTPYWSSYTKAYHQGDYPWIKQRLRESLIGSACLFGIAGGAIALFHEQIIGLWTSLPLSLKKEAPLFALLFTLQGGVNALSFFLNGLSQVSKQTRALAMGIGLHLVMSSLFGLRWGASGLLWGALLGYLPLFSSNVIEAKRMYVSLASRSSCHSR